MSNWHYRWDLNVGLPPLGEHSKAKHNVYREYLKRYLREVTKSGVVSRLLINIVDGFSGGGAYIPEQGPGPYFGSPIILLETLLEMQIELQARRREPFLLDYRLHLVDQDQGAHDVLRRTLVDRGFGSLIGDRVFPHSSPHFRGT
jgi:three-Cys-motif partner protein